MTEEQWLPVVGWVGLYEVSDQGRVRSVERIVPRKSRPQKVAARLLKTPLGTHGYPRVNLCRDGRSKQVLVHRLVLEAFVGPPPPGMECLHRKNQRHDARLSNLKWGTSAENKADTVRDGTAWWLNRVSG